MSINNQTINPKVSSRCGLMALTLIVTLGCFAKVGAQWTTPDASQNINNTNTGNVGIGTSTPGKKLEVLATDGEAVRLYRNAGTVGWGVNMKFAFNNSNGARVDYVGLHGVVANATAGAEMGDFLVSTTTSGTLTEKLRVTSAGNVGIGTAIPDVKLQVHHSSANTNLANVGLADLVLGLRNTSNTNGNMSVISFQDAAGYGNVNITAVQKDQTNHSADLLFLTRTNTTTFGERMRVTSTGNVGIGTPTPSYRLDVQGGSINTSQNLCINGDCKSAWSQIASQWANGSGSINYAGGSVGIGITSPLYTLDVNGGLNGLRSK